MISEINERIRNKEQFIKNVNLYHYSDDGAVTAKHICINEVAFLKELLQYVDRLECELEKKAETIADLKQDNKYFRKELGFWKGYVTGDEHDYEYDSLA
jgi:hypothetical protein